MNQESDLREAVRKRRCELEAEQKQRSLEMDDKLWGNPFHAQNCHVKKEMECVMLPTEETKEQFMERYALYAKMPDVFKKNKIALPCDCEVGGGPTHWAALSREIEGLIRHHLDFHAPKDTPWPEGIPEHTVDKSDVSFKGIPIIYQENMG